MMYSSAEANKLLKKLNADYQLVISNEFQSKTFLAASGEDVESVRPVYDYEKTQSELKELSEKIRKIKHAINVFNINTVVEEMGMTVDELLVYLPQLSSRVNTLAEMRMTLPKTRERTFGSGTNTTIDYRYANYDIEKAAQDYEKYYDQLTKAQTALDRVNSISAIEIEL